MTRALLFSAVIFAASTNLRADDKPVATDSETIAKFLTTWQMTPFADRGRYVTDPADYGKGQSAYYNRWSIPDDVETTVSSVTAGPKPDYLTVMAKVSGTANGRKGSSVLSVYLVNAKAGLKVDWAASVGYNPVAFKAWAAGNDETLALRAEATLSDYYNYQYRSAKATHYSISFEDHFANRRDRFHGYVPKDSALGKKLFDLVKDGQPHKLIVTIQRTGTETLLVGITDLNSTTWVK
jgi:hypothetical protein